jgi:hypothetical protein
MRASRATELADKYPSHVCAAWLGHTEAVADEFYRQVTDDHFAKAITSGASDSAAQNPAQCGAESTRNGKYPTSGDAANTPVFPSDSTSYEMVQVAGVGDEGFEPPTSSV